MIGYSLAASGDSNAAGEPVWYGGSKLAPDLSINRLRERLPDQEEADRPRYVADPAAPWRHTTTTAIHAARTVLDSVDDAAAQGHLAAFGDALYDIASATTGPHRAELRAAAMAFNRARRSATRADHEAATALRKAEVLNWRITAQPNRRTQAARMRSATSGTSAMSATPHPPAAPVATRLEERSRHR